MGALPYILSSTFSLRCFLSVLCCVVSGEDAEIVQMILETARHQNKVGPRERRTGLLARPTPQSTSVAWLFLFFLFFYF